LHRLYFAYGSNMSPRQMARRCPGARPVGRAALADWRFNITKRGSATISRDEGATVHGVLWRVTPAHVHTLDLYEGVAAGHYVRRAVAVTPEVGVETRRVLTYVHTCHGSGTARVMYMTTAILPGARAFGLPGPYIEALEAWLPAFPIGEKRRPYIGRKSRRR